ncbi:MAG: DUF1540 domain-containing protein [Clostridia bacterium]|nr:DUF1540 domain-containing protein [Clostridia bacterium]
MKRTPKQGIVCDVSTCIYNVDGRACCRKGIVISTDTKNQETHYCKSFERSCGFKEEE